jgi:hypothetical protein
VNEQLPGEKSPEDTVGISAVAAAETMHMAADLRVGISALMLIPQLMGDNSQTVRFNSCVANALNTPTMDMVMGKEVGVCVVEEPHR